MLKRSEAKVGELKHYSGLVYMDKKGLKDAGFTQDQIVEAEAHATLSLVPTLYSGKIGKAIFSYVPPLKSGFAFLVALFASLCYNYVSQGNMIGYIFLAMEIIPLLAAAAFIKASRNQKAFYSNVCFISGSSYSRTVVRWNKICNDLLDISDKNGIPRNGPGTAMKMLGAYPDVVKLAKAEEIIGLSGDRMLIEVEGDYEKFKEEVNLKLVEIEDSISHVKNNSLSFAITDVLNETPAGLTIAQALNEWKADSDSETSSELVNMEDLK